jgi:YfiH family protein
MRVLQQVHGVELISLLTDAPLPVGDGWVGEFLPGDIMCIRTADCLPLLLWTEKGNTGAAVHAGWRSAVAGISASAVKKLGGDPSTLHALIGPAIRKCCFEVGEEVAEAAGVASPLLEKKGGGKYHFDLAGYVKNELLASGLLPEKIEDSGYCTKCDQELFYSHRGSGTKGRMASFIGVLS